MPRLSLIQPRRGTAAEWTAANPVLAEGEEGLETDTDQSKRGDGVTAWTALPYVGEWDSIPGRPEVALAADLITPEVLNGITEWWCRPVATYLNEPYPRTVFGAIAKNNGSDRAPILACEFNHATKSVLRVEVGTADVDDHNAPALWVKSGRRPVITWNNHSQTQYCSAKVGARNGDLRTLAAAPEIQIASSNPGGGFSYTQLMHIPSLSDAEQDTFWMFSRVHNTGDINWRIFPFRVNQATGAITEITTTAHPFGDFKLVSFGSNLGYMTVSDAVNGNGDQIIRCAYGYNPSSENAVLHGVYYFEINVSTGAITSPFDAALTANLDGTNLPLVDTAQVLAIANPPTDWSRRLFYTRPGPALPAILYGEGPVATPDAWTYKQLRMVSEGGPVDGLRVGANAWASGAYAAAMHQATGVEYRCVMSFDAAPTATVELGRRFRSAGSAGDGNRSWFFRMTTGRILQFAGIKQSGGAQTSTHSSTVAVPGAWTDEMGFGFRINFSTGYGVVTFIYSTDGGDTWNTLGSTVQAEAATWRIMPSDCPLEVPSPTQSLRVAGLLKRATLLSAVGATLLADADFADAWPPGTVSYTDPAGIVWTLQGAEAQVGSTDPVWVTEEFGIAGPRIGFNSGSNYIPGMSYPDPCYDDMVYAAYKDAATGVSTVVEWRLQRQADGSSAWVSETLATAAANEPQLARPISPVNGGPHRALVNRIVEYHPTSFLEYEANIRATV